MVVDTLVANEMFMSRVEKVHAGGRGDVTSPGADVDLAPILDVRNGDGLLACRSRP
jgi:hypothetical protein